MLILRLVLAHLSHILVEWAGKGKLMHLEKTPSVVRRKARNSRIIGFGKEEAELAAAWRGAAASVSGAECRAPCGFAAIAALQLSLRALIRWHGWCSVWQHGRFGGKRAKKFLEARHLYGAAQQRCAGAEGRWCGVERRADTT